MKRNNVKIGQKNAIESMDDKVKKLKASIMNDFFPLYTGKELSIGKAVEFYYKNKHAVGYNTTETYKTFTDIITKIVCGTTDEEV
jgi:hypothetical protein